MMCTHTSSINHATILQAALSLVLSTTATTHHHRHHYRPISTAIAAISPLYTAIKRTAVEVVVVEVVVVVVGIVIASPTTIL